jgi:hypothetical protein
MDQKTQTDNSKPQETLIANPLYDHVFKYLMDDNKVARKFISTIIGEDVIELSFAPQEYVQKLYNNVTEKSWNVYRLDFVARIQTEEEEYKTVIIEILKFSFHTDFVRFWRYLDGQYCNKENIYYDSENSTYTMPVYSIFFIADGLGIEGIPVVTANPCVIDAITSQELENVHSEFMDSLHYSRSWIIQIPELKGRRRTDLEVMLSIFEQTSWRHDYHILCLKEEYFSEEYCSIIRRLQQAVVNKKIREAMFTEDDIIEHFRIEERKTLEKLVEKDAIIAEKDALLAEIAALKSQQKNE